MIAGNNVYNPVSGNQSFGVVNSSSSGSQSDVVNTGEKGNILAKQQNSLAQLQGTVTPFPYQISQNNLKILTAYTPDDFIGSPVVPTNGGVNFIADYLQAGFAAGRSCMFLNSAPNLPRIANGRDPRVAQFTADDDATTVSIISVTVEKIYTDGRAPGLVTKIGVQDEDVPDNNNTNNRLAINLLTSTAQTITAADVADANINLVRGMGSSIDTGANGVADAPYDVVGNNAFNLLGGGKVCRLRNAFDPFTPGTQGVGVVGRLGAGVVNTQATNFVAIASAGVGLTDLTTVNAGGLSTTAPVLDTLASSPQSIILGASNIVPITDVTTGGNAGPGPITGTGCGLKVTILYAQT